MVTANAQVVRPESLPQGFVIVVSDESQAASASKPIFLASGANSWNPGDPAFVLSPRSDKRWQLVVEPGTFGENVEFKFTLGSWATVETAADGQNIDNRKFPDVDMGGLAAGERPIVELSIPRFQDGSEQFVIAREYRPINATGTVKRLQVAGGAGGAAGKMRDLLVWLPPGYESESRSYPVLYMLDGQNLFEQQEGVPGEWRLDETATALVQAGAVEPFIAVGVPSLGASRFDEYTPRIEGQPASAGGVEARGDTFLAWLGSEVMPRVERAFRAERGPARTAIGGASLGGLFALYASHASPERFGMALVESPALEFDAGEARFSIMKWIEDARFNTAGAAPSRVFIGMGGLENIPGSGFFDGAGRRHLNAALRLYTTLSARSDTALYIVEGHEHNEPAWAARLAAALTHLFPPRPLPGADRSAVEPAEPVVTVRLVVVDESGAAGDDRPVVMPGSHNGWNPADAAQRLTRIGDRTWAIDTPLPKAEDGPLEFKFALGSWDAVELAADGSHTENRVLPADRALAGREMRFAVPRFATPPTRDTRDFSDRARPLDVTGRVERLAVRGGAGSAGADFERDLFVWLPDGYDPARARPYPVVVMLDGQHAFERTPGAPGEWRADETATALISAGSVEPFVIVAVPNSGVNRAAEYVPAGVGGLRGVVPDGDAFVAWLAGTVLKEVRGAYRVVGGAEGTVICGASLGGVLSLHAATTRPDVFGAAIVESCSMLSADGAGLMERVREAGATGRLPARAWIGMGGAETGRAARDTARNAAYVRWAGALRDTLVAAGMSAADVRLDVVDEHTHTEAAWAERLPGALRFVLGSE